MADFEPEPEEMTDNHPASLPPAEGPGSDLAAQTTIAGIPGWQPEAPLAAGASIPSLHPTRAGSRRSVWGVVGAVFLLLAVLSGSVLTANGLASMATLAPSAPLWSPGQAGSQHLSGATRLTTGGTTAPCNCSSQHTSYAPPPYLGQVIVVSISQQQMWAYQDDQLVMTSLVTTGMPQLPTPTGAFHIMMKESNVWFYSPWPQGSPYYYTPEFVPYAMLFRDGGFYLHAAPWRETFGPGTNVPHTEPDGTTATGSHGCVNLPTSAAGQLYAWVGIGATVVIKY